VAARERLNRLAEAGPALVAQGIEHRSPNLDGSTLYDSYSETAVPAVVLRMPPHRAACIGKVLDAYTRVCRLAGTELPGSVAPDAAALGAPTIRGRHAAWIPARP
jgi:hypothetical protein